MECFSYLLAAAVVWLIIRDAQARGRIKAIEAALESQQRLAGKLAERLESLRREIRKLHQEPEEHPEPLTPVPSPEPHPLSPSPISLPPLPGRGGTLPGLNGQTEGTVPGMRPPSPGGGRGGRWDRGIGGEGFDWENLVGVRLFSWMAGIMLAIAAVFFLRYSIQQGWLGAPVRMAIGILTGAGLLVVCEWKAARRYSVTANALDAAGIAILFSTIFASNVLWGLLGSAPPSS